MNSDRASEYNLWSHTLKIRPKSSMAREHLRAWWVRKGRLDTANDLFIQAHELDPGSPEPLANLVTIALMSEAYQLNEAWQLLSWLPRRLYSFPYKSKRSIGR